MFQPKRVFTITLTAAAIGLATLAGSTASGQPESKQPPVRQPGGGQPGEGRQPGQPGEGRQPGRGPGGQAPSVEGSMKGMNRAMKQLLDQVGDASKKEENLRLIGDMERSCAQAKNGQPNKIKEMKDEAARTKASVEYRKHLIELMRRMLDVEESIMAGNTEAANKTLGAIEKMRDEQHKALGVKED